MNSILNQTMRRLWFQSPKIFAQKSNNHHLPQQNQPTKKHIRNPSKIPRNMVISPHKIHHSKRPTARYTFHQNSPFGYEKKRTETREHKWELVVLVEILDPSSGAEKLVGPPELVTWTCFVRDGFGGLQVGEDVFKKHVGLPHPIFLALMVLKKNPPSMI